MASVEEPMQLKEMIVMKEMLSDRGYRTVVDRLIVEIIDQHTEEMQAQADADSADEERQTKRKRRKAPRVSQPQPKRLIYDVAAWFGEKNGPPDIGIIILGDTMQKTTVDIAKCITLDSNRPSHLIIVRSMAVATARLDNMAKEFQDAGINVVEHFLWSYFTINKTHNTFVPMHQLLSTEQAEIVKQQCGSAEMMSAMRSDDPIAKYYGADVGDVFRILRDHEAPTYRVVRKE